MAPPRHLLLLLVLVAATTVAHASRPWSPPPAPPSSHQRHHYSPSPPERRRPWAPSPLQRFVATGASCDNVNQYDKTAHDPVGDWMQACNAQINEKCQACSLWTDTAAGKPGASVYSPTNTRRAKIIPTRPLQGLESIVRDKADTSGLFVTALKDAAAGNVIPAKGGGTLPIIPHPIVYINSLAVRTEHQWHAHVGPAKNEDWYECAKSIIEAPPQAGRWVALPAASKACQALTVGTSRGMVGNATTASGSNISSTIREGFLNHVQGAKIPDITQDKALLHTGALVQRNEKGGAGAEYLVFVLSNTDDIMLFGQ
jgi:hypothetical protein